MPTSEGGASETSWANPKLRNTNVEAGEDYHGLHHQFSKGE